MNRTELSKCSLRKLHLWFGPTSAQLPWAKPAHNGNMLFLEEFGFGNSPRAPWPEPLNCRKDQAIMLLPGHFWNNHCYLVANYNSRLKLLPELIKTTTAEKKRNWNLKLYLADKIKGALFRTYPYPVGSVTISQMTFSRNCSSSSILFLVQSNALNRAHSTSKKSPIPVSGNLRNRLIVGIRIS